MSHKKHSLRIGRREKRGAIIGAIVGAVMGGCIATGTGLTASDIFLTIAKWAVALAIVGMWIRLSMIVDAIIWVTLGAVAGIVASLIAGAIGIVKLEVPESLINGAGIGILVSVVGYSFRTVLMWRTSDRADAVGERE